MKLILYTNKAESNRLDKTDYLSAILTLDGYLREGTSIINPSIIVDLQDAINVAESNNIDVTNTSEVDVMLLLQEKVTSCNYVYIPDFKRYYFVTDVISIANHIWRLEMSSDPLMSFKDEISEQKVVVNRNQTKHNAYMEDTNEPLRYNSNVEETELGNINTFSNTVSFTSSPSLYNIYFILTVFDNNVTLTDYANKSVNQNSNLLPSVSNWAFPSTTQYKTYFINYTNFIKLQQTIIANENLASGVVSLIMYPFNLLKSGDTMGESKKIKILDTEIDAVGNNIEEIPADSPLYSRIHSVIVSDFIISPRFNSYLDYSPYSKYELFIPYKGWITLDPVQVLNKDLRIHYAFDFRTGSAMAFVIDETSNKIIYGSDTQLGIVTSVNSTNLQTLNDQLLTSGISSAIGVVGGAVSVGLGIATLNPLLVAGGGVSIISGVSKISTTMMTQHETASCQIPSGEIGLYASQKPRLRVTYPERLLTDDYAETYASTYGYPTVFCGELSELEGTGFTVVTNCHLDNIPCLDSESNEIEADLKSGVIL